jgi:purine-nucleoside phosphorylase
VPVRLTPLEPPAADAIVVGDSRRAFALAQALTVQPRMSHQARGLWGYTGTSESGLDLTVQSTGVGGPSAVAVISDLIGIGTRRIVRLGTCVSTSGRFRPGAAVLVERAIAADGAGRALIAAAEPDRTGNDRATVEPDRELFQSLSGLAEPATVSSHDLVARLEHGPETSAAPAGMAPVRDLQTAATLALAAKQGVKAAALLIVAEDRGSGRLAEPELERLFLDLAPGVLEALGRTPLEGEGGPNGS